jgi:hypothetical protein
MKTLKLNHKCPVCNKDIFLNQDTAVKNGIFYHLDCYIKEISKPSFIPYMCKEEELK